ncbi:MAG: response regulator [Planctomycetaceae bacterium]|nr:response regulator [Planctomycetaceae bacterium]
MPYARVLVVDDIITNLDVVKGQLQAYKIHVHCVTNGPQAVSLIRDAKVKFDAIFMDHMMAEMDGIEATRIIRQIDTDYARNIPIIALTANAIIGNEEMFLNNGFQAFLSKPVDIARLDEVIQRWIRDRSQEELLADLEERQTPVFNHCRRGEENRERRRGYDRRMCNWKITGLNIRQGIEQFGGEEFYQNVLRSFARNTVPLLEIIKDVDKNNLADYATVVHGLKGSCRAICAEIVGDVAKLLENAALEGNFALIMDYNATFVKTIHNLINEIENLLQSRARENPRPQKDKIDIEILSKLLEACESYDMDEVDAAMETLEEYEYSTDEELVVWLRENVDRMNFTQIRERLLDAIAEKAT